MMRKFNAALLPSSKVLKSTKIAICGFFRAHAGHQTGCNSKVPSNQECQHVGNFDRTKILVTHAKYAMHVF